MCKLKPLLQRWLQDADASLVPSNGSTGGANSLPITSGASSLGAQVASVTNSQNSNGSSLPGNSTSSAVNAQLTAMMGSSLLSPVESMCKRRKKRTSIETTVRISLEKAFLCNQKPTFEEIAILADKLNMEKEVVRFLKRQK